MAEVKYRAVLDTLRNINPEDNIKYNENTREWLRNKISGI